MKISVHRVPHLKKILYTKTKIITGNKDNIDEENQKKKHV
jgi:hypothetical protein